MSSKFDVTEMSEEQLYHYLVGGVGRARSYAIMSELEKRQAEKTREQTEKFRKQLEKQHKESLDKLLTNKNLMKISIGVGILIFLASVGHFFY